MGHKPQDEIQRQIDKALKRIQVGGLCYHYKAPEHLYVIEFVGCLESTEEVAVGYRALYGKGLLWIRTLENFLGKVKVDGEKVKRFQLL